MPTQPEVENLSPLARTLYDAWKVVNANVGGEINPEYAQRLADEMERVKPFVVVTHTLKEN